MSLFPKSNKKASSRQQLEIQEVRSNILVLPENRYRLILRVSAVNFELMSDAEQDALIDGYQQFLQSLTSPLQLTLQVREINMRQYIDTFTRHLEHESNEVYERQILHYTEFIERMVRANKIVSRACYIVIPFDSTSRCDMSTIEDYLQTHAAIVSKGLAKLGIHARQLTDLEILDFFYSFYSPETATQQPLSDQALRHIQQQYI